jgi:probable rRNA maturation factor
LNHTYRGLDKPTDVLSFSAPATAPQLLGEIIIDPREIERLAKYKEILEFTGWSYPPRARRQALDYLVCFIFIHGLLHLIGYDDAKETERQTMLRLGRDFLKQQGISGIM